MKRISAILLASMITMSAMCTTSFAAQSLDDVIGGNTTSVSEIQPEKPADNTNVPENSTPENSQSQSESGSTGSDIGNIFGSHGTYNQVDALKEATNLNESSEGAKKINQGIKSIASFVVQVLAYAVTALLVLRVLLDLAYICLPFTRSFLANGYGGNAQAGGGNGMPGMGSPMGGMGMGGMGMNRGMGMGGMGGMGMNGMNGMGMGGMQQSQPGASPAMGRIQWVSNPALNAVAAETVVGPDGKAISPMKMYAKDMIVILILAPTFLVLAITGSLTNLGLLIGDMLSSAISNIGTMV